jgi:hypothetical protein
LDYIGSHNISYDCKHCYDRLDLEQDFLHTRRSLRLDQARESESKSERKRESERERERERVREREREKEREREREREIHTHTERQIHTHRHKHIYTQKDRHIHTQTHTDAITRTYTPQAVERVGAPTPGPPAFRLPFPMQPPLMPLSVPATVERVRGDLCV